MFISFYPRKRTVNMQTYSCELEKILVFFLGICFSQSEFIINRTAARTFAPPAETKRGTT